MIWPKQEDICMKGKNEKRKTVNPKLKKSKISFLGVVKTNNVGLFFNFPYFFQNQIIFKKF